MQNKNCGDCKGVEELISLYSTVTEPLSISTYSVIQELEWVAELLKTFLIFLICLENRFMNVLTLWEKEKSRSF